MLFAMVSTVDRGNFVLDRWPHEITYPSIASKSQSIQFVQTITRHFNYFGFYPKNDALKTSSFSFSEACLLQTFIANEKRLQSVLGIQEQCVLVSRGLFFIDKTQNFSKLNNCSTQNNYYTFQDCDDIKRSKVNSISLIWNAKSFQEVEPIKHRISFLLGVLERKQSSNNYLSQQIAKIIQAKYECQRRIKDQCINFQKQNTNPSQFQIKNFLDKCYDIGRYLTKNIQIFDEFQKFGNCLINGNQYEATPDPQPWQGSMGSKYKIPGLQNFSEKKKNQICQKTLLLIEKKLEGMPNVLYDERVKKIAQKVNARQDRSLKQIIEQERQLTVQGTIKTVNFLIKNDFGVLVYPFNRQMYLNTYVLNCIPNWGTIKKFNKKIFPKGNIMHELIKYSTIKQIQKLTREDKYIIIQKFVSQLGIYIYYFDYENSESSGNDSQMDNKYMNKRNILKEYANTTTDINQIVVKQPHFTIRQICKLIGKSQIKKAKEGMMRESSEWGFYYVQK